jgi:hypothetical protein
MHAGSQASWNLPGRLDSEKCGTEGIDSMNLGTLSIAIKRLTEHGDRRLD